ncbi:MAG TPA: cytochrome c peroxidase, partial [Bdellovibrionales bacterium]|nr:cytochrome c peroxidase [Bdellovibrionales bacterium]
MKKFNFASLITSLVVCAGCSGGSSPSSSSAVVTPEVPITEKPVRPPVQPDTCSATESYSFAPMLGASSLPSRDVLLPVGGFNGNTWDGRVFLLNNHDENGRLGWWLKVFRPERLTTDAQGYPDFNQGALSDGFEWLEHEENPRHVHIGLYPNTSFQENPFRSNRNGEPDRNGDFETYEVYIIAPVIPEDLRMQMRRGQIIVGRPKTGDAYIADARWTSEFEDMRTVGGKLIRGLEPSISGDGRLLVYNGSPENDGNILVITYSYNTKNGAADGWSEPRSINDLYHVDRNKLIDGLPIHEHYPIAKKPLRDMNGQIYAKGEKYWGAYPWISLDGTEVFHTSTIAGCHEANPNCPENRWSERTLRGGFAVIGRYTNYTMKLIDGSANPDRNAENALPTIRTLTGGITQFGTMWEAFREVERFPLPYTARRPSYGLIGNVRGEYSEVSFEDAMDGNYVLFLRMNELVSREKVKWFWEKPRMENKVHTNRTPDTSPYMNHGTLKNGAAFPQEYNGFDGNIGRTGQAIYFTDKGRVEVAHSASLAGFDKGLSVELWARREVNMSGDEPNRYRYLIRKGRQFDIVAEEGGPIQVSVNLRLPNGTTARRRSGLIGNFEKWTHLAFTFNPADGKLRVYMRGRLEAEVQFEAAPLAPDSSPLVIGPGEQTTPLWPDTNVALFRIDEVKVSNTVREPDEIRASAFVSVADQFASMDRPLPLGLRSSELRVPASNVPNTAAVALGERLFFDPILSLNRDMSCATCHRPELGFADGRPRALGFNGKTLRRNTPTIFNRAFSTVQFWEGGVNSVEEQALVPIANPEEMNLPVTEAVGRLQADPGYAEEFRRVYGSGVTTSNLAKALASFQRAQLLGNSRVDQFEAGNRSALNESEIRGRVLFHGKARCVGCHNGGNYTDESFHFTGFTCTTDYGREEASGRFRDRRLFKTPTLRGVAQTAPYL